jgi:hypothetical protein
MRIARCFEFLGPHSLVLVVSRKMSEIKAPRCGLNRKELADQRFLDGQKCMAKYEDDDGNENVCGRLFTSHKEGEPLIGGLRTPSHAR